MSYNLRKRQSHQLLGAKEQLGILNTGVKSCETSSSSSHEDLVRSNTTSHEDLVRSIQDRAQREFLRVSSSMEQKYLDLDSDGWDDFMASDYMTGGWKDDVEASPKTIKKLSKELGEILDEMRKESPNVQKILESDLTRDEKKGALYKLDVLKNMDSADPEYGKLRRKIMKTIQTRHPLVQKYLADKKKSWEDRIMALDTTEKIKGTLIVLANQLGDVDDSDFRTRFNKLEMILKLPYDRTIKLDVKERYDAEQNPKEKDRILSEFIAKASEYLDSELYKLDAPKKKILGVMSKYIKSGNYDGCVIGLVGKPGVGKTHIARVFADTLGLPFTQCTLGASDDLVTLLGSDNTWVGSSCGDLASAYMKMGCCNGVICFDEVDKCGKKIWNAINHIIDPEANFDIRDAYLRDVPINCHKTIFVLSLNDKDVLPPYLLSRIIPIPIPDQTKDDKFVITKFYKIPKLDIPEGITFSDQAIKFLVHLSDQEGYREIHSYLKHIVESLHLHVIMMGKKFKHCNISRFKLPFVVKPEHVKILTRELNVDTKHLTMFT